MEGLAGDVAGLNFGSKNTLGRYDTVQASDKHEPGNKAEEAHEHIISIEKARGGGLDKKKLDGLPSPNYTNWQISLANPFVFLLPNPQKSGPCFSFLTSTARDGSTQRR